MIASNRASSSANDVSIRHASSGIRERGSRQTVTPSPSGRRTSNTATVGRSAGTRASASAAVTPPQTTSKSRPSSSMSRRPRRTTWVVEEEHADPGRTSIALPVRVRRPDTYTEGSLSAGPVRMGRRRSEKRAAGKQPSPWTRRGVEGRESDRRPAWRCSADALTAVRARVIAAPAITAIEGVEARERQ